MSSVILNQLLEDIKTTMKARETDKLTTLRSLHAQIKDAGTNAGKEETDELVAIVIAKAIKQRQDSIEQFKNGGRDDLVTIETTELTILKAYQPPQLSEAEIEELVQQAIVATGAASKQDMGKVMGALMPKVKGKADGKLVNQVVQRLLA